MKPNPILQEHFEQIQHQAMTAHDNTHLHLTLGGLQWDYQHHRANAKTLSLLCEMVDDLGLRDYLNDMFNGEPVNNTEKRAALHAALRDPHTDNTDIKLTLARMNDITASLHEKTWLGGMGETIEHVVQLGIGGSYWGPKLAVEALADQDKHISVDFVAELDPAQLHDTLQSLNPHKTLFIVASKSFTTYETLENAQRAKAWLNAAGIRNIAQHFIAITQDIEKAQAFGIPEHHCLPVWDWVGGRYSVWSAMGLSIALCYGMPTFEAFLRGAHAMDEHVKNAEWIDNIPVLAAVLSYWYSQYFKAPTHAILPYPYRLRALVPYCQQLEMESLGKACDKAGQWVDYPTGNIVWGSTGTQAQHAYNQLLHQGTHLVPVDFIVSKTDAKLMNQAKAQSQALSLGDPNNANPHARLMGNQPHTLLTLSSLSAENVGLLMSFYEYKTIVSGFLLNINPFDQFGVEHSKKIARGLMAGETAKQAERVSS